MYNDNVDVVKSAVVRLAPKVYFTKKNLPKYVNLFQSRYSAKRRESGRGVEAIKQI
jgi:hypothetical protein